LIPDVEAARAGEGRSKALQIRGRTVPAPKRETVTPYRFRLRRVFRISSLQTRNRKPLLPRLRARVRFAAIKAIGCNPKRAATPSRARSIRGLQTRASLLCGGPASMINGGSWMP
jgi:hypothetical protein